MCWFRLSALLFSISVIWGNASFLRAEEGFITEVRYFQTDERYEYRIKLLDLVMSKTKREWGDYRLAGISEPVTQARGTLLLERGEAFDIAALPTNHERENKLLPIRIPILNGILGYRVLLIHEGSQQIFSSITSLEQLKKLTGGFVSHWSDFALLKHNKLNIMSVPRYDLLFPMLEKKRFDYIPRGINEAWIEIEKFGPEYRELVVEQSIGLYYPYYVYFFVSRTNPKLAQRIEEGLELALEDGTFKKLFLKYHQHLFQQASLSKRQLLILENSNLPQIRNAPKLDWWLPDARQGE